MIRQSLGLLRDYACDLLDPLKLGHFVRQPPAISQALVELARSTDSARHGPRVLVVSFRGGWLLHGTWEALIAAALNRRGANCAVFVCSGGLPEALPGRARACGIANVHAKQVPRCRACRRAGVSVARALRLPVILTDELVDPAMQENLMKRVATLDLDSLRRLHHRGHPIGEFAANSVRWFLCVGDLDGAREAEDVLRSFAQSAVVMAEAAPVLLDRVQPEVVLMLNGLFCAERIVKAEAERRGIRVVSYERGFEPDTLCFSRGVPGYYDIDPLWREVEDVPLSLAQETRLDNYLAARKKGLRAPYNYWPTMTESEEEVILSLGLSTDRHIAVLFSNITWDSAAQDRDCAFRSMYAWVVECIRLFGSMEDAQLVVRIHPAEVRVPGWETRDPLMNRLAASFPKLPPNVRVVSSTSELSSYTLMNISRCGLVYTSTAGLEMAMGGIPVVVAGRVHYAGKGFTLDPADPEDFARLTMQALGSPRSASVRDRARRYGHALFFRYFHQFPLVSENTPDFMPTLNSSDSAVLDPGGDPTLDRVCEAILSNSEFFAPGA